MSAMSEAEVTSAPTKSYRKRNILRLILVGTAALCIPAWMSLNILRGQSEWDEMEYDAQVQRYLAEKLDDEDYAELNMPEWLRRAGEEDGEGWEAEMAAAMSITDTDEPPLPPYSIEDAARATNLFHNGVGILVYEPSNDNFYLVYNDHRHAWSSSCVKLATSFRMFVYMLRDSFPERFQGPKSQEWAVVIGSGDYPHLHPNCLGSFPHPSPKCEQNHAPVLQFGSAFRHKEILPNMIAMPQPSGPNLLCFKVYLRHPGQTCKNLKGLTSFSSEWELRQNLIPQVVWRGTDFGYLNHIEKLRKPFWGLDIKPQDFQSKDEADKKVEGTHAMRQSYDSLYPRWKGVVLTAEAEREAEEKNDNSLPWANIKFTSASPAARAKTDYSKFAECGIPAIGERMSIEDLAKYKYQIDLGGGGGTTWSGTHEKLAMPGLLFHHVTPTKDYIHDRMEPWVHYVPVAPDLTDLREKYEWAESHPEAAKKIANQGSALMQHLISSEGFGWMYDKNFKEPVRRAMEAVSVSHPGSSWREVLIKFGGSHAFSERMRCEGRTCSKTFGTMI